MGSPQSNASDQRRDSGLHPAKARTRRHGFAWTFLGALCLLVLIAAGALAGGFIWFVNAVPERESEISGNADGIVVFTGGTSRVEDAMQLLADGRGKRLLISGVNRNTTPREIARLVPQYEELVACCVDLDYAAMNTAGNATGARRWVHSRKFRSLIVVTSSYHMPRSMAELGHQLSGVKLIAFPVVTEKLRSEPWWSNMATARLLFYEYLKYMVAQLRIRLEALPDDLAEPMRAEAPS